jgi:hypothetical protein
VIGLTQIFIECIIINHKDSRAIVRAANEA